MTRFRRMISEWITTRARRTPVEGNRLRRATRDIVGPTGYMVTKSVDSLAASGEAYMKSFDDRIPPSLFVSERDRTRLNEPMPLRERPIADVVADPASRVDPGMYERAFREIDAEMRDRADSSETDKDPEG